MKRSGQCHLNAKKQRGTASLFVFLLLFLLLSGCGDVPDDRPEPPQGSGLSAEEESPFRGYAVVPPVSLPRTFRADYDRDGREETFAVIPAERDEYGNAKERVWFMSAGREPVSMGIEEFDLGEGALLETAPRRFLHFEAIYGTGWSTILLTVRNGEPSWEPVHGQGLTPLGGDEYAILQNTLDGGFMEGMSMGRTVKPYWLYWDAGADAFREYGAVEISREQLSALPGGAEALAQVDTEIAKANGRLDNILYRGNKTVQINYTLNYLPDDGSGNPAGESWWRSLWLDPSKEPEGGYEYENGIYLPALLPEIAVYPDQIPV